MRTVAAIILLALFANQSIAVDYRWLHFIHMEEYARIINGNAAFQIYCSHRDGSVGAELELSAQEKTKIPQGEPVLVQLVVDDKNFGLNLVGEEIDFNHSPDDGIFYDFVRALLRSRDKHFLVELPKYGISETFSLLSVKTALGAPKDIVFNCKELK